MKHGLETQRSLFTTKFAENESVTHISYKIVKKMTERGKPFNGGNIIKECMMEVANVLCCEKAALFESISLSAGSIVQKKKNNSEEK